MHGYLADLVAAKRARPADDLLTDLVEATDEGERLDAQELLAMTFLLLIAGYVTTVSLIGNGTLALLRQPEQLDRLRADPSLVPQTVEELLRFDGPVNPGLTRFALEDLEIGGVRIPRGDMVMLAIAAADRDPRRFPDPDRLDVGAADRGSPGLRARPALLPGCAAGPAGGSGRLHRAADPAARPGPRRPGGRAALDRGRRAPRPAGAAGDLHPHAGTAGLSTRAARQRGRRASIAFHRARL